jgi:hypothetical protein
MGYKKVRFANGTNKNSEKGKKHLIYFEENVKKKHNIKCNGFSKVAKN